MAAYRKRMVEGKVRWDVTVTRRGAPRMCKTFPTKALAERWALDAERNIARGAWRSTDVAERTTVADLLDRYLQQELPKKKSARSVTSAAAILRKELGRLPILALDGARLAEFREHRLRSDARIGGPHGKGKSLGRKVSTETVRKELQLLQRIINIAMREWGLYLPGGNPLSMVKLPATNRPRDRRLSEDEYERLLVAARSSRSRILALAIELAVETAMRRGELVALCWEDIDLKRRVARIRDSKNGEPRDVPLSMRAVEVLQSMPRPIRGGPIFGKLRSDSITQAFERVCERLGLENLRWHDLRHEATSRLVEKLAGDIVSVSAITGHKTLQMLKRYTHPRAEDLARRLG